MRTKKPRSRPLVFTREQGRGLPRGTTLVYFDVAIKILLTSIKVIPEDNGRWPDRLVLSCPDQRHPILSREDGWEPPHAVNDVNVKPMIS